MRHRPVIHGGGRERESSGGAVLVFCLFLLYGQHDRESIVKFWLLYISINL